MERKKKMSVSEIAIYPAKNINLTVISPKNLWTGPMPISYYCLLW